jgi:23S rRNA pseudouridine1911/1915/1917 synthase
MVFAKTSKAAARLSAQFSSREAKKRYCAIVCGYPKPKQTLTDWLYKDENTFSSREVPPGTEGAKQARFNLRADRAGGGHGASGHRAGHGQAHQIRVQLMNAG